MKGISMKKKSIVNLIRYYSEKNDNAFKNVAFDIARDFNNSGDQEIAEYIMSLLSDANSFSPQSNDKEDLYFKKLEINSNPLPLPKIIADDILGIVNAIDKKMGVNKFLFKGKPGTGKTETAKQIGRILNREVYEVNFDSLIDYKLGETSKRISKMFEEIYDVKNPSKTIFLFDELDAIAINRINSNDLREMGRATSSFIRGLDRINNDTVIIATTNLFDDFDKAIVRRFDSVIDFDRYTQSDLLSISETILDEYLSKDSNLSKNSRLFKKIASLMNPIPAPGELRNIIKTSVAFSNPKNSYDYFARLFANVTNNKIIGIEDYEKFGFSLREIEILTGKSKSSLSRDLRGKK